MTAVLEPAALPAAVAEIIDMTGDEAPSDNETASEDDAHPEQDTSWPSANEPIEDSEAAQQRAVLDSRVVEAAEAACGQCGECLLGRPENCLDPQHTDTSKAEDALKAWRERATLGIDVSTPLVKVLEGQSSEDIWYEVCGYQITDQQIPIVRLRPDWRPPGDTRGPGEHLDLTAGQHVEVSVGPFVRDHRDDVRVLTRTDGQGRFLLREAPTSADKQEEQGQLAISLNRQHQGLLRRLREGAVFTVTAIPRKEPGCVTVTLLELLHQHFTAVNAGMSRQFEIKRADGNTMQLPFYPAVVVAEPNRSGYADVELLGQDQELGIVHGAAIFVDADMSGGISHCDIPIPGTPIYLRLNRDAAKLPLSGLPLATVRELVAGEKTLVLNHEDLGEDDACATEAEVGGPEEAAADELGTLNTRLVSRGAVPRAALDALIALNPAREWESQVWQFWARSRHLRTDRQDPCREGALAEPVQRAAVLAAELPKARHISLEEAHDRYPKGTPVQAVVENIRDDIGRAWLRLSDGARATVGARDVSGTGGEPLTTWLTNGMDVDATVTNIVEHRGEAQVQVKLDLGGGQHPEQPAQMSLAEATARYPRGSQVDAVVDHVRDDVGRAWLRLSDRTQATAVSADVGTNGVIRLSGVLGVGQVVPAIVKEVTEHRGDVQVRLDLGRLTTKPLREQLADIGVHPGARVRGSVARLHESLGVFIEVAAGTNGLAHVSTLPGRNVAWFEIGQTVDVDVIDVADDPRKPGRLKIGLRLA